jgi:hypothetical protein
MPTACITPEETKVRTAPELSSPRAASAALRELCNFLFTFPNMEMSEDDCAALAAAALSGHAEAEFMVGSVFDAAGETARAMDWYWRSASRDYLPAMLQLFAIR